MNKVVKIATDDCPVCLKMAESDEGVAKEGGFDFQRVELSELAARSERDIIRSYLVRHHVNPDDGMVDVPVYMIVTEEGVVASSIVKTTAELQNLLISWELFKQQQSPA